MSKTFFSLTPSEQSKLIQAPALLSVLASCSKNEINKTQKAEAIRLAHLKTYTADPILHFYYLEVEKSFKHDFEAAARKYYPFDDFQRNELEKEIGEIYPIIQKLDEYYAHALSKSLAAYAYHIRKAAHSIFQDFIFPISIPGLNDH